MQPNACSACLLSIKRLDTPELGLGEETVRSHVKRAEVKLGVGERTHAGAQARRVIVQLAPSLREGQSERSGAML